MKCWKWLSIAYLKFVVELETTVRSILSERKKERKKWMTTAMLYFLCFHPTAKIRLDLGSSMMRSVHVCHHMLFNYFNHSDYINSSIVFLPWHSHITRYYLNYHIGTGSVMIWVRQSYWICSCHASFFVLQCIRLVVFISIIAYDSLCIILIIGR
jgi:hypothetical protein